MTRATIAYAARTDFRQRYYANDHSRDTVVVDPHEMEVHDARQAGASLDAEGFVLARHVSKVSSFEDREEVAALHSPEIVDLLKQVSGADEVFITSPGILRFSERSGRAGSLDNSMPARFAHIDASLATSATFAQRSLPEGRKLARYNHFNVWRAISPAPQDVPLALCDTRSAGLADYISADAIFDPPGGAPEWSFESWLVAHNPAHRWLWYPNLNRDEAIVFKTSDSVSGAVVPHVAFDDPDAPADCPPRASIEVRAVAYWYA